MRETEKQPKRVGRPPKYSKAMTPRERQKEYQQRLKDAGGIEFRVEIKDSEVVRRFEALATKFGLESKKATGEKIITDYIDSVFRKTA